MSRNDQRVSVLKWCKCFFQHTARFLKMATQSFPEREIYLQLIRPTGELLQPVDSAQLTHTWPAPFFTATYQTHPHNVALYLNCPVTNTDVLRHRFPSSSPSTRQRVPPLPPCWSSGALGSLVSSGTQLQLAFSSCCRLLAKGPL